MNVWVNAVLVTGGEQPGHTHQPRSLELDELDELRVAVLVPAVHQDRLDTWKTWHSLALKAEGN